MMGTRQALHALNMAIAIAWAIVTTDRERFQA